MLDIDHGWHESLVARAIRALAGRVRVRPGGHRSQALGWLVANGREVDHFVKFGLVGAGGALLDVGLLNALILLLAVSKFWANACSFSAAACSNFVWNRLWTFPESQQRPFRRQFVQFFTVSVVGLLINQVLFLSLDHWVFGGWGPLGYNLAKAVAILVVLFWNFGANRVWTYRGL